LANRTQRLRAHLLVLNIKGNTLVITRERVEAVLGRIRPFMQADGGDIELVVVDGNSATIQLTGMCATCPSAQMTLFLGVEAALRESLPEFETLRVV
jgi:Fe-S cluster biogenesis protein NfuA